MLFIIHGNPVPSQRPRVARNGGVWDPKAAEKKRIRLEISKILEDRDGYVPFLKESPVEVHMYFYWPMPKKMPTRHADFIPHVKKPDLDNLSKTYLDCMNGLVWHDDAQVVCLVVHKYLSPNPRTEIHVRSFPSEGSV